MAEPLDGAAKEPSTTDVKENLESEFEIAGSTLEKELRSAEVLKTQADYRKIGKSYIESIKASLLASSAKYSITLEDPYLKAYKYLEENKVLALLEDLITYTAFQRPNEPFPFMSRLVEDFYKTNKSNEWTSNEAVKKES
ncbi:uncharacterized protein LOC114532323 [Dendronephthya gigantea]|uniref:uncharacterized protein LOC114532323 n=1 Tax=Dendronephthya gigantea TaxID=151771 RepID=UPI00106D5533|nr:uncharacterized protein LOC114532323 [Dendronephthya gigantea]